MRVLGLDPGGTTGAVVINWTLETPIDSTNVTVIEHAQLEFPEVAGWLHERLPDVELVGVERFIISPRTTKASRQYEALYVIGGTLMLCQLLEHTAPERQMILQPASVAKSAWTNERLKETGLHGEVVGPHARDALRHALLACHSV